MKVAAYCRVSTDKQDQANSFESQQRYFGEYIARHPDWELYQIYADEGVTGTSTQKRAAFNRMICDARLQRFDLILTKEVSRFSRNILDTISYTRDLRQLGIGVLFVNDGINSLEPDSELRLSIMGSIAQEESRRTSSRVKWGQARRMEQGVVFGHSLLGYDVRNGKITVNPEGAEIVRMIFHKYVHERKGTGVIARELQEAGCKTLAGAARWRNTVILKILRNEKYCGDLKQKKTITPNYLTHQKQYNHGEEAFICLKDHHQGIISRELWEEAQREIARRDNDSKCSTGHGHRYPLSGKIKCGGCGQSFVSRGRKGRDGGRGRVWRCGTAVREGKCRIDAEGNRTGCNVGCQLRDEAGMEMVRQAVNTLELDTEEVICDVIRVIWEAAWSVQGSGRMRVQSLEKEAEQLLKRKKGLLDAFLSQCISGDDMRLMNAEYDSRLTELSEKIAAAEKQELSAAAAEEEIRAYVAGIVNGEAAPDFFYSSLLQYITVYPDQRAEVCLKLLPVRWVFKIEQTAGAKSREK